MAAADPGSADRATRALRLARPIQARTRSASTAAPRPRTTVASSRASYAVTPDDVLGVRVDQAIAMLERQNWLVGRPVLHWQNLVRRLEHRERRSPLPASAAATTDLFTGGSIGALAALWAQERALLRAELQLAAAAHWQQLTTHHSLHSVDDRLLVSAIALLWRQLEQIDLIDRTFGTTPLVAVSHGATRALIAERSRPARRRRLDAELARSADWLPGMAWLPEFDSFIGWLTTAAGMHLFAIDRVQGAEWVRGRRDRRAVTLRWHHTLVTAVSVPSEHTPLLTALAQLQILGAAPVQRDQPELPAWQTQRRLGSLWPTTRVVMTVAESRTGIEPVDLATGEPAPGDWVAAKFRSAWSATEGRFVKQWVDAHRPGVRRASNAPVLVTLLP